MDVQQLENGRRVLVGRGCDWLKGEMNPYGTSLLGSKEGKEAEEEPEYTPWEKNDRW
jgi:hypothetical protein